MKRLQIVWALLLALCLCACAAKPSPAAPVPEPASTASPTAEPTPVPSPEPTAVPTPEPTPEPTPCPHARWEGGVCADCGELCLHPIHDAETRLCAVCGLLTPHSYEGFVCTRCGSAAVFEQKAIPRELFWRCEHQGTVEKLRYQAADYREGFAGTDLPPLNKEMAVYLPYGYDPAEKYDVLILMHGMYGTEDYWLVQAHDYDFRYDDYVGTSWLLDQMMDRGLCRKMIVATPCFYRGAANQSDYIAPIDEPGFVLELREAVLPALAAQYSTWAEEPTTEGVAAAREHFAYAGLSMGSMYAYSSVIPDCLDLFASFGCFSGSQGDVQLLVEALNSPPDSELEIRLFYNSCGNADKFFAAHQLRYQTLVEQCPGLTDGENAVFTPLLGQPHTYSAFSLGLYNLLPLLFPEPIG